MRSSIILCFTFILITACDSSKTNKNFEESNNERIPPVTLDLDEILARGYINACVDYSSTTYFVYRGEIMGFEYDLLKRLGQYLNVKVNIIIQPSIEESIRLLNRGEVDIIAQGLTITKARKKIVGFTNHYITQRQVLVQRKPSNWRDMKLHEIEKTLIRDQVDLIGKKIYVLNHSSYIDALQALSEQIGGDIDIEEVDPAIDTEQIIKDVVNGNYMYTVADENIALVNRAYYPILDVNTPVSFPRRIAWASRINAPKLIDTLNYGIGILKKQGLIKIIYDKYYRSSRKAIKMAKSDYASFNGKKLSPYDELIKENANKLSWDWRLLASMVYQESKFDPNTTSWAGAQGLLQIMPATAGAQNVKDRTNPAQNLRGGTAYLLWLEEQWQNRVEDPQERLKFVMASYNVGIGHVYDACALTEKFGGDPTKWENVSEYLLKLSSHKYYLDPVVKVGYARGTEPVNYVEQILARYEQYKQLIPEES